MAAEQECLGCLPRVAGEGTRATVEIAGCAPCWAGRDSRCFVGEHGCISTLAQRGRVPANLVCVTAVHNRRQIRGIGGSTEIFKCAIEIQRGTRRGARRGAKPGGSESRPYEVREEGAATLHAKRSGQGSAPTNTEAGEKRREDALRSPGQAGPPASVADALPDSIRDGDPNQIAVGG